MRIQVEAVVAMVPLSGVDISDMVGELLIAGIFFGLVVLGVAVYFGLRSFRRVPPRSPDGGTVVKLCRQCGQKLDRPGPGSICPRCGAHVD